MKVGDKVEIIEDSAMSLFGYSLGSTYVVLNVDHKGQINIDASRPNEFWKTWRFKVLK